MILSSLMCKTNLMCNPKLSTTCCIVLKQKASGRMLKRTNNVSTVVLLYFGYLNVERRRIFQKCFDKVCICVNIVRLEFEAQ